MTIALAPRTCAPVWHAVEAMATRFELVLHGAPDAEEPVLRSIAEEALREITRLDSRLSAYQPASDISWINAHAAQRPVKVEPELFALLQRCVELSEATDGAFDITMGPLMRAWKFMGDTGALPSPEAEAGARTRAGYQHLQLDTQTSTVRFMRPGMSLDLGGVGKGYAIDKAVDVLRTHGIDSALIHGGTSSVHAIGRPPDGDAWRIAWSPPTGGARILDVQNGALSVSAIYGKAFWHDGRCYGHVIDPRTGRPTDGATCAVVTGPGSLECDAVSTALLVNGGSWLPALRTRFPGYDGEAE